MTKLYIRDDDVSYFTQPQEILEAYGNVLERGPVSFAIIPFAVKTWHYGDPNLFGQDTTASFPVHENTDLVAFLRDLSKRRRAYIMLHGYNHIYYPCKETGQPYQIPEFANTSLDFHNLLLEGRQYLEDTFGQHVKWFIPPSNSLCRASHRACAELGMNIPYVFPFRQRRLSFELIKNYLQFKIASKTGSSARLRLESNTEVECHGLTKSTNPEQFINQLPNDDRVIFSHYWEINQHPLVRSTLDKIVSSSSEIGSFDEIR